MEEHNILTIIGPTASGKTRLAVELAVEINGEIISGDSRQVYIGMDIGTGKDIEEYNTPSGPVSYHLIDIVSPFEDYNLFRYIKDFNKSYEDIVSRKKFPILCGGSGLYIEAALKGYNLPDAPENKSLREELELLTKEELISMLREQSTEIYNNTDISSKRRIIRGIEIALYMKENKITTSPKNTDLKPIVIGISLPREELIARIDERLEKRLNQGMIDEVKSLIEKGVPLEKLYKLGLEYRYCSMYLNNQINYDDMVLKLKTEIHRFSKRQMTWFRGMGKRGIPIQWIDGNTSSAFRVIENHGIIFSLN
ncbi:MAG TPA: tRNA (adenosine(37)-N6)-dimethylallyltransferase MiaA [Spirochaetota bacterium]|nr:tRNA (adenosine(37)-N6)-dimethylallyltransferase MiaA [Spirochaetota bacterium]HOK92264.1 tRNA (adenosine(37)-N6)-dimethylallyltransferase MiaA [Spirochaetota bacterium]HPP95179.1 tRNA (adenosine(37)-N6)-dimethylallyltransferase MiaA [Spirochaetota bacterium]